MTSEAIGRGRDTDEFTRLHRIFVGQFGVAVGLAWAVSGLAATQAPWLRNLRGLLDPFGPPESTASFLFGLPLLMTLAWLSAAYGAPLMRRTMVLRNQSIEFGCAGLAVAVVLALAVHRAATALAFAP